MNRGLLDGVNATPQAANHELLVLITRYVAHAFGGLFRFYNAFVTARNWHTGQRLACQPISELK